MHDTIEYEWVIASYSGETAKQVKGLAEAGLAYFFQRHGGAGQNYQVSVGFRRAIDGPRPEHMELATPFQVQKLDQLLRSRQGIREQRNADRPAMTPVVNVARGIQQGMYQAVPAGDR